MINQQQAALELFQKAQIVFKEQSQVINAVLKHGDALDAHAKSEAAVKFRIIIRPT